MLFVSINIHAQDILITSTGDSIKCKITLVNDNSVFYDHKVGKSVSNEYIPLQKLSSYVQNGIRTDLKDVVINKFDDQRAGDALVQAARITHTSVIITLAGIAIIAVSVVTAPPIAIVGGVIALAGEVYSIKAWGKIKQAGEILNKHKI